jgi:hypothetical protein
VYLKDSNNHDVALDSADSVTVTLSLLNSDGDVVAASSPQLIDSLSSAADKGIPFTAELSASDAKTIVVTVSKAGFTDYARRLEFSPDVNVTATLNKLQELRVDLSKVTSISGKILDGYNVSVNNSNGAEDISSSDSSVIADLSVSIPQSALPVGTSSVDVNMQAFDPNNQEDAQNFPGAYEDSAGNKLLSVAFNYTDIKTNAGVSLQKLAQTTRNSRLQAQKRSGKIISPLQFAKQASKKIGVALEPVIINRKIPQESCLSLSQLGDANSTQNGFQVPVYTYNPTNGLWDLLGYGTLFDEAGVLVPADQKIFDCKLNIYVLEIEATNEIFLSNWWNLDYPLVFTQPTKLCANLEFRDKGNKPVPGSMLFVADDDDLRSISSEVFITDVSGRVRIELMSLDNGVDITATANIYNASFYSAHTSVPITLSTVCDLNTPPVVIPIAIPEMCNVEGSVVDADGMPLNNRYIMAGDFTATNLLMPAFAVSDAAGHYKLSLQCKQNYQVIEWFSAILGGEYLTTTFLANVNNTVEISEVSDNGLKAVMKDLKVNASKPLVMVSNLENSQTQLNIFVFYGGKNFPLAYNFSLLDRDSKVIAQYSGSLVAADFNGDSGDKQSSFFYADMAIDHKLPSVTNFVMYTVKGEMTDSKGNKGTIFGAVYQDKLE